MPKVLISDQLSDQAVEIFRDRGIEVDFQPDLGRPPTTRATPSAMLPSQEVVSARL